MGARLKTAFLLLTAVGFFTAFAAQLPGESSDKSATQTAPTVGYPTATTTDVLMLSREVLELSRVHNERSFEYLKNIFYFLGGVGAFAAFLGYRTWESVMKPVREKLEKMQAEHEQAMRDHITQFEERLHLNTKAQLIAANIWQDIEAGEKAGGDERAALFQRVVEQADSMLTSETLRKVDAYLAGVLLIRKAFALKRLGKFDAAYSCAIEAVRLADSSAKNFWVYNAACYAALCGKSTESIVFLSKAIQENASARSDAIEDDDFDSVRDTPEFKELLRVV